MKINVMQVKEDLEMYGECLIDSGYFEEDLRIIHNYTNPESDFDYLKEAKNWLETNLQLTVDLSHTEEGWLKIKIE